MPDPAAALATQLANIEKRTGKPLAELVALLGASGAQKHGEQVAWLKTNLGMGHGDANTLAHHARAMQSPVEPVGTDPLDAIYTGAKAGLRATHEALVRAIDQFGAYETAPKKGYVSLRRAKQFCMLGPATQTQIEIGINAKQLTGGERLKAQAPGGMCAYKVRIASTAEVDAELLGWLRTAYEAAG